jgi:hypothetical protein
LAILLAGTVSQPPRPVGTPPVGLSLEAAMRSSIQYFDGSVFSIPANGTYGNLGHNALRGPGRDNWNLSLFKTFSFTENSGLQLRVETFNVFNHTQFHNVSTGATDSRFGQFTDVYPARIMQLSGKVYF